MREVANVIDVRIKALQRQIMTLERFATTPSGIFETIDQMVKNFRMANKETMEMLMGGKTIKSQGLLERLRRRGFYLRR